VKEAISTLTDKVKYEGIDLTWSASELSQPFLDMQVFIDLVTNQVEWKPYCKLLNHLKRIPWVSHHPLDIKHRTFIGKVSHLAILSSKLCFYLDAIRELEQLYIL
jgi:hypothetical protein